MIFELPNGHDHNHDHDQPNLLVRAGTPFLLGPEGAEAPAGDDEDPRAEAEPIMDPVDEVPTDTAESTKHSKTHTSTLSEPSSSSSEDMSSMSSTITSAASTLSPTSTDVPMSGTTTLGSAVQVETLDNDPPAVQLSSLAYLVPVFLFLFITIAALIYRKYRARKRIDRESSSTFRSPLPHEKSHIQGQGWKEVKGEDDDDKDGIWNDDSDQEEEEMKLDQQWRDIYVKESKSRPGLLDVSTAGGWLRSSAWKSARSINDQAEGGQREKTVKLVTRSIPTYESLLPGQTGSNPSPSPTPSTGGRFGSLRAFRDSFNSITLHPIVRQLERNKSPNKRRVVHPPPPPPEEPAWIRPRAASPVNVLSPPSQPHFFFQPTHPQSMVMHRAQVSESEYSVTETDSESLLSNVHQRHVGFSEPTTSTDSTGKLRFPGVTVDLDRTPTKSSMATIKPVPGVSRTSTGIRRSSAVRDLALAKTPSKRQNQKQRDTLSPNVQLTPSARKHKKQMKDDKARQRVESILQASWSDRALSSPSASMDSLTCPPGNRSQVPGWASPGVEQVGGIQARLAMIRSMENK